MQIEKILSANQIQELMERNYGTSPELNDFAIFTSGEDKIWVATKEVFNLKGTLRANSMGLYIGKLKRGNKINLSVEGIQLLAKNASKNIVRVDEENMKRFMRGSDISNFEKLNCETENFVLVKYKEDFIGVGILEEDKIKNLLPKSKRIY